MGCWGEEEGTTRDPGGGGGFVTTQDLQLGKRSSLQAFRPSFGKRVAFSELALFFYER